MRNAFGVVAPVILFAMLLLEPASVDAQLSPVKGTCEVSNIAYVTAANSVPTQGSTIPLIYTDVPNMSVTVLVTPVRPGGERCLEVSFSAVVHRVEEFDLNTLYVRALLDGTKVGSPVDSSKGGVFFTGGSTALEKHSNTFTWIFPNVADGTHTVKIQMDTPSAALLDGPTLGPRSLVVRFK